MLKNKIGKIIIPAGVHPWPHELRVAEILAEAGHKVEFIPTGNISTADIYLDEVEFEIKSPLTNKVNTLEHRLKDAIRNQSHNIIFCSHRVKRMKDSNLHNWLTTICKKQPQIKRMIFINKSNRVVDIK